MTAEERFVEELTVKVWRGGGRRCLTKATAYKREAYRLICDAFGGCDCGPYELGDLSCDFHQFRLDDLGSAEKVFAWEMQMADRRTQR